MSDVGGMCPHCSQGLGGLRTWLAMWAVCDRIAHGLRVLGRAEKGLGLDDGDRLDLDWFARGTGSFATGGLELNHGSIEPLDNFAEQ